MTLLVQGREVKVFDILLGQALSYLLPKYREVLLLAYFLGESDTEIARRLGMTYAGIQKRRKHALSQLKRELEALGYGPTQAGSL